MATVRQRRGLSAPATCRDLGVRAVGSVR